MAHFDLEAVMKKVDELLALELHITESETRKDAWDHLERTGSIYRTVNTLGNEYESLYNVEVKKKNSSYAKFTVDYFLQLGKSFTSTEIYIDQQFSLADRNAIYNFLGHCVFVYGQNIDKGFSASTDTNASISSSVAPETERGLLSLGGGCMGEIWKVNKGRKQNASLSVKQRQQAQNLYDMTFQLKMTFEEKKDDSVPIGLRIRDHGGLFIPKTAFLPFLKETINLVMKYANEASYRRYGKGMLKVAESTSAWFITSGFGFGVMKLVAEAVRDSQSYNKSTDMTEERFTHKVKCIGVGPWGCIDKREDLETIRCKSRTLYVTPKVTYIPGEVSRMRYTSLPLDTNHTHFVFIDNGFRHRFTGPGNISEFRAAFQEVIAAEMNMVMLLIEGGIGIIHEVFNSLEKGVPIVVCEGTYRAADIIADIYHTATNSNELSDYQWRQILTRVCALGGFTDELCDELMFELKVIAKNTHLITIFNIHRNDDLINCLLQALCTARKDDHESQLRLALSCNRAEFAEMNLFRETSDWSTDFLHKMMEQALNENKLAFAKLLIKQGVHMHDFLTVGRLTQLYKNNLQKSDVFYLSQLFAHWSISEEFNIAEIGSLLGHLLFAYNTTLYSSYYNTYNRSQEKIRRPDNELFVWAVLMNRQELAIFFWEKGIQPVAMALGGTWLYKSLIKNTDSAQEELLQTFHVNKDHFEKLAIDSLNAMYERYPDEALEALNYPVKSWSDMTCMELAAAASDKYNAIVKVHQNPDVDILNWMDHYVILEILEPWFHLQDFLSTVACQTHLRYKWLGDIQSQTYKVFFATIFPFLMWWLIRFKKADIEETSSKLKNCFMRFCVTIGQFYTAPLVKYITFVLWYLAFLLVYTYMVLFGIREEVSALQIVCFVWVCSCICDEIHRCLWSPFPTLKSRIKMWLDWVHFWHLLNPVVAFVNFFLHLSLPFVDVIKMIYCLNLALFYLRILKMYTASEFLGPKLQIIQTTTKKLLLFFMILMVFLLAYGTSSNALLFPRLELTWDTFVVIMRRIIYMPYWQIYGELQLDELENDEDCFAKLNITDIKNAPPTHCRTWSRLVPAMLAVYLFFASILLLNLIIAIFSQIYESIENNCMKVWKYQMYFFITEYEVKSVLPLPLNLLEYIYLLIRWLCQCPCRKSIDDTSQKSILGWLEEETHRKMLLKKEDKRLYDETDKFSSLHDRLDKIERRLHSHEELLGYRQQDQQDDNQMLRDKIDILMASQSLSGTPPASSSLVNIPDATSSRKSSKIFAGSTEFVFGKSVSKSQGNHDINSKPKKAVFDSNSDINATDEKQGFRPNIKFIRVMSEESDGFNSGGFHIGDDDGGDNDEKFKAVSTINYKNGNESTSILNNDEKSLPVSTSIRNDGKSNQISPKRSNSLTDESSEDEGVRDTDKLLGNNKHEVDKNDVEVTVKQFINSDNDLGELIPLVSDNDLGELIPLVSDNDLGELIPLVSDNDLGELIPLVKSDNDLGELIPLMKSDNDLGELIPLVNIHTIVDN